MIELAHLLVYGLGWLMVLLIMYVVLFRVYYHSEDNRPWWLWPAAIVFILLDVAINLTLMSVIMLDIPEEWTVTARMKRYKASSANRKSGLHAYRFYFAESMCMILNVFDKSKGAHC